MSASPGNTTGAWGMVDNCQVGVFLTYATPAAVPFWITGSIRPRNGSTT